jgi:CHAT domain-containing protein
LLVEGAQEVLAANWNADSAAASYLMQSFYRGLEQSRLPIEALRAAVRQTRRQPEWENPYYWAMFSLFVQR